MKRKHNRWGSRVEYGGQIVGLLKTTAQGDIVCVLMEDCGGNAAECLELYKWHFSTNPEEREVVENIKNRQAGKKYVYWIPRKRREKRRQANERN